MTALKRESEEVGLLINVDKSKLLAVNKQANVTSKSSKLTGAHTFVRASKLMEMITPKFALKLIRKELR